MKKVVCGIDCMGMTWAMAAAVNDIQTATDCCQCCRKAKCAESSQQPIKRVYRVRAKVMSVVP